MWGSELSEGEVEVGVGGQCTKGVKDRVDLISLLRALHAFPTQRKVLLFCVVSALGWA